MSDRNRMSRRDFLGAGAAAAALAGVPAGAPAILDGELPARTIGVGCIGLGTRGGDLINEVVRIPGVRIVAYKEKRQVRWDPVRQAIV